MYKHVLVALDNSSLSHDVAKQAIELATAARARLTLLHVLSPDHGVGPSMPLIPIPEYYPSLSVTTLELYQEKWKQYQAKSIAFLEQYRAEAESAGLVAECYQKAGRPGQTICEVAKKLDIDLIIVGRRGHSVFDEMLIGSVSSYVIHHAYCAVLVCNGKNNADQGTASAFDAQSCHA